MIFVLCLLGYAIAGFITASIGAKFWSHECNDGGDFLLLLAIWPLAIFFGLGELLGKGFVGAGRLLDNYVALLQGRNKSKNRDIIA